MAANINLNRAFGGGGGTFGAGPLATNTGEQVTFSWTTATYTASINFVQVVNSATMTSPQTVTLGAGPVIIDGTVTGAGTVTTTCALGAGGGGGSGTSPSPDSAATVANTVDSALRDQNTDELGRIEDFSLLLWDEARRNGQMPQSREEFEAQLDGALDELRDAEEELGGLERQLEELGAFGPPGPGEEAELERLIREAKQRVDAARTISTGSWTPSTWSWATWSRGP
jgi:hypothetical protein